MSKCISSFQHISSIAKEGVMNSRCWDIVCFPPKVKLLYNNSVIRMVRIFKSRRYFDPVRFNLANSPSTSSKRALMRSRFIMIS